MTAPDTLRLWTQRLPAEAAILLGGHPLRAGGDWQVEPGFGDAYRWMCAQLRQRVGPPPPGVVWPIWAWGAPPDQVDPGQVLLALEVPRRAALLSDFDAWHCVLNDTLLAPDPQTWAPYQAVLDSGAEVPARIQAQVAASWQGIFDLTRPALPGWRCPPGEIVVQAVLWEIRPAWVRGRVG